MSLRKLSTLTMAAWLLAILPSCDGGGQQDTGVNPGADTLKTDEGNNTPLLNMNGKLFSIPSPVQTALLIKKAEMPYRKNLPLSTDSLSRFITKEKRALALGMMGADLAYHTVFKDGQAAIKALKAIEQLSVQLNLDKAFDKELVDGFKRNMAFEDSLLRFSGKAYLAADRYLKEDRQEDVSAGVLAGGWIESLYLSLGESTDKLDPMVAQRVAEQRIALTNLIGLLQQAKTQEALVGQLQGLKAELDNVKVTYTFVQPTVDAAKKTTFINSTSSADIPQDALQRIVTKVREIRSSILA
jgi:hypothetical protein